MLKTSARRRNSRLSSRLKGFTSFTDNFSTEQIKSSWKINSGSWSILNNNLITLSDSARITIPASKSNATATINLTSASTGVGPIFWSDGNNYWAAFSETSESTGPSNCTNQNCSGTESYTATRSCSCTNNYGTCQLNSYPIYGTCGYTYGTCSQSTTYGTCASSYTYGTCTQSTYYGTCVYTAGSSSTSYEVNDGGSCSPIGGSQVGCSNCSASICGRGGFVCCAITTVSGGSWNYGSCYYNGQQVATGTSWNYDGCSYAGQQVVTGTSWNYGGCSYAGQQVVTGTSWNYGGCSYAGQQVVTGWNYGGCSSVGQQIFLGNGSTWNYGGCSSNGQQVIVSQSSNCNNGNCSGTESYTASRSCSCSTITSRIIKVIKVENGITETIGSFSISSTPSQIQISTSGNDVVVSAGGVSNTYTNNSLIKPKGFGIIKRSGILEQGNSVSSFSVLVN